MTSEERAAVMKAYQDSQTTVPMSKDHWIFSTSPQQNAVNPSPYQSAVSSSLPPGGIVAPPSPPAPEPEAKPVKPIHEMRFADYQRGVEAWWPSRKR